MTLHKTNAFVGQLDRAHNNVDLLLRQEGAGKRSTAVPTNRRGSFSWITTGYEKQECRGLIWVLEDQRGRLEAYGGR
jgi:hypothetical protein